VSDERVVKAAGVGRPTAATARCLLTEILPPPASPRSPLIEASERLTKFGEWPRSGLELAVVVLPTYAGPMPPLTPAYEGDVGVDLYAAAAVTIGPQERALIPTGITIAVPDGFEAQVRPRSGNAIKRGLTVLNTPGTIDPGFRGEVQVIAFNSNAVVSAALMERVIQAAEGGVPPGELSDEFGVHHSLSTLRIEQGEKIAQLVFAKFERPAIRVVASLSETERGERGYGSSG
jgi:dUTP pyrophosphatase